MKHSLQYLLIVTVTMFAAQAAHALCIEPDSGAIPGTADLPPAGCAYTTPYDDLRIVDGLPPLTTIEIDGTMHSYSGVIEVPGGGLGGHTQTYQALMNMPMIGTGFLAGFNRNIVLPLSNVQTHSAPRTPGTTPQSFITDMAIMQGQIVGDPDFDLLRITAGTNFGLPSPGHTTLTRLGPPGSNWNVDSFFDVTYRIDFVGRPGSLLGGMSGSTTRTIRMQLGGPIPEPGTMTLALLSSLAFIKRHRSRQEAVIGS